MARRGFTRRDGRTAARETIWFGFAEVRSTLASASLAAIFHSLNAAALALRPFTIVRSHFLWHLRSDQAGATENADVGFGIAVVSDQASAVGVTAVPTPFADFGSGLWFSHTMLANHLTFISGVGVFPDNDAMVQIDSKAMRKVDSGQDIVTVLENSSLSDGSTSFIAGRMLVKLH